MINIVRVTPILISLLLSACGNLQAIKPAKLPISVTGRAIEFSSDRPTKAEVMPPAYEIPNHSLFIVQKSGGSVALGLLLGPLGILANASNIDRITKEMGAAGSSTNLFQVDAKLEAETALSQRISKLPVSSQAQKMRLKPYIVYLVADEKIGVDVLVQMRVDADININGKPSRWVGNYSAFLDQTLSLEFLKTPMSSDGIAALRSSIILTYDELLEVLAKDLASDMHPKQDIAAVTSRISSIAIIGDVERNRNNHMVLRSGWGEYRQGYNATVFQNDRQYVFANGPVHRD